MKKYLFLIGVLLGQFLGASGHAHERSKDTSIRSRLADYKKQVDKDAHDKFTRRKRAQDSAFEVLVGSQHDLTRSCINRLKKLEAERVEDAKKIGELSERVEQLTAQLAAALRRLPKIQTFSTIATKKQPVKEKEEQCKVPNQEEI